MVEALFLIAFRIFKTLPLQRECPLSNHGIEVQLISVLVTTSGTYRYFQTVFEAVVSVSPIQIQKEITMKELIINL